ncbi:MAG: 3-isopropylmalate dehydratase small subunit [Spirochaetaceae bacterium]|nr:3-isopropylmalate dehydratase small subunit [Spirochaetaceae bacterium]
MKSFGGRVLFLDRSDINTDEIIPAKYLTENTKAALGPYLLEDLTLAGFDAKRDVAGRGAVVSRGNFGCGSSREHAPWALEANGINIVIAESFARIFRGNMYNCGMIAAELPPQTIDALFREFAGDSGAETLLTCDIENATLTFTSGGKEKTVPFTLKGFDRALVETGGWVAYADGKY